MPFRVDVQECLLPPGAFGRSLFNMFRQIFGDLSRLPKLPEEMTIHGVRLKRTIEDPRFP